MSEIGDLASGIWTVEFDSDTGVNTIQSISGWLQNNIGLLNTYIYSNYSGENPGFEDEENAIFTQLYLYNYYKKSARSALRGVLSTTSDVTELEEGDTRIRFANKGEVGKTYRGLSTDAWDEAQRLIHAYNMYEAAPRQIGGYEGGTGDFSGT